ncbi:MAG: AAA family ATPase [Calditrichaeota bacterium]|nr:AAA family ATPase [Calditrichota bacterium]
MKSYLKRNIHHLYLIFFRPTQFSKQFENAKRKQLAILLLELLPFMIIIPIFVVSVTGILIGSGGEFNWSEAFLIVVVSVAVGVAAGVVLGVAGETAAGVAAGVAVGVVFGATVGLATDMVGSVAFGVALGIGFGVAFGVAFGAVFGNAIGMAGRVGLGIVFGVALGIVFGVAGGVTLGVAGGITLPIFFNRYFYILPYLMRTNFYENNLDWILFQKSFLYFDENVLFPLPFLHLILVSAVKRKQLDGDKIINFLLEHRPSQRSQVSRALYDINFDFLSSYKTKDHFQIPIMDIHKSPSNRGLNLNQTGTKYTALIFELANQFFKVKSLHKKRNILSTILDETIQFKENTSLMKGYVRTGYSEIAIAWERIFKQELLELDVRFKSELIPNIYYVGNPLDYRDETYRGRDNVVQLIEDELFSGRRFSPMFLNGKRRIGKTSTLQNLRKTLGPSIVPVYLNCQDARMHSSNHSFFQHILKLTSRELTDRGINAFEIPDREDFQTDGIDQCADFFDRFSSLLRNEDMTILICLDEYEKIEEGYLKGRLSDDLLNHLRHMIQHQERFAFIFAGVHRMASLKGIDWSNYLINLKTIPISWLDEESSVNLIENPITEWRVNYESGLVERILLLTHCQPYLLQAVGFELVTILNQHKSTDAKMSDLDQIIERVLVSPDLYFQNIWSEDLIREEREFVLSYIKKNEIAKLEVNRGIIHNLIENEIFEIKADEKADFAVELFKLWVEKNADGLQVS